MNRKKAQDFNRKCAEINAKSDETTAKLHEVGEKLLNDDKLTSYDLHQLATRISEREGYSTCQLVIIEADFDVSLIPLERFDSEGCPIFVLISNGAKATAVFTLLKHSKNYFCLLKDFSNPEIFDYIKAAFEERFDPKIKIITHASTDEIIVNENLDVLALKTLETMMVNSKPEKMKEFVENFSDNKKCFFRWLINEAGNLKKELFNYVKESYYRKFESSIDQLSKDTVFKAEIKAFINNIPLESVGNFKTYQKLLKEFVELDENEIGTEATKTLQKKIDDARKTAFDKIESSPIVKNMTRDHKLQIEQSFPDQMKKFTEIFNPLAKSHVDENLNRQLEEISKKLDLDYEKLKSFFQQEEKLDDAKADDFVIPKIENIIERLPVQKSKDASVIDSLKPLQTLLSEIVVENDDLNLRLRKVFKEVKTKYDLWIEKSAHDIYQWAVSKKGNLASSEFPEALAVMDRANQLATGGHTFRDSQILAALTFLLQEDKGQLSQIQTGEGKTTIVSVLAAIKALQGQSVDVITSNPVLALEGVKDKNLFLNLLGLSATTNNLDENYISGERDCYKADIVYGSIASFQFDFLKDSFLGLKTRAGRPFACIILDEVDSMIIDNASHIAKLSEPLPGMDSLKYIYIKIWQELIKAEESIVEQFEEDLKAEMVALKLKVEQKEYEEDEAQFYFDEFKRELEDPLIPKIKNRIKLSNPTKIDIIPSHIQEYAEGSLEKWIDSALNAKYNYCEDEHYVIRKNKEGEEIVQPVDYANTGITLKNTVWQYGLHQFLQLKHNLHLTSESMTSCFISNLGYINKYGSKIYGLTGTLGSQAEKELLSSLYNVDFAKIPTYKEKQFSEFDGIIVDDEAFSSKVAEDVIVKAKQGRSTLIICETIKDAKNILISIEAKGHTALRTFFDEENVSATHEAVKPGTVVIATNIAGRGTDLKTTPELEKNGGLHVCVPFLPCNKRVEDQAFGRTSRQGNKGTAQIILKQSEVDRLGIKSFNFDDIKSLRDLQELARIDEIKESKILELNFQDKLFELFSELYKKLRKKCQNGDFKFILDDLKEFWAFWLEKKNFKGSNLAGKTPEEEFEDFKAKADATIRGQITFNPYYSIKQAEHFIQNDKFNKAEAALEHAIAISGNKEILHGAYIKLFEISIEKGEVFLDKCQTAVGDLFFIDGVKPDRDYKDNAKHYLKKAQNAFQKEIDYMESLYNDKDFGKVIKQDNSSFMKHLASKKQVLELNKEHTASLILQIDTHAGGIAMSGRISDYLKTLKPQNETETKLKESITDSELSELASIGTNTTFSLRELHDIPEQIALGAQVQIGGGLALLAAGCCFPPALPIMSGIGSTMITEGLCDIAMELINKNSDGRFNQEAYIKGKVISYGMSLLTMGIKTALECPRILNAAKKACRWISATLRKCPFMKKACCSLANKFDQLANWFEKLETIAKLNKMGNLQKVEYFEKLKETKNMKLDHLKNLSELKELQNLKNMGKLRDLSHIEKCVSSMQQVAVGVATGVTNRIVKNQIMSKIVTPLVASALDVMQPAIINLVDESVRSHLDQEKLQFVSVEEFQKIIKEVRDSVDLETIAEIFKESILGMAKQCSSWQLQLGALAVDQFVSWKDLVTYVKNLCKKINEKMKSAAEIVNKNVAELVDQFINQMSEEVYGKFVQLSIKTCQDVYSVGMSAYKNHKDQKERDRVSLEHIEDFKKGGPVGQEHLKALADVKKQRIEIHEENGNIIVLGEQYRGDPVKVSYFPPEEGASTGHYVPFGEDKSWSTSDGGNNCAFEAYCATTNDNAIQLRGETLKRLQSEPSRYMANNVRKAFGNELAVEGGQITLNKKVTFQETNDIIKNSQDKPREPDPGKFSSKPPTGHALGHTPSENHTHAGSTCCVERFSQKKDKSAFISKNDQTNVLKAAIEKGLCDAAVQELNIGKTMKEPVCVTPAQLGFPSLKMMEAKSGSILLDSQKTIITSDVKNVTIVLAHHKGTFSVPDQPPFVVTIYPSN